MYSAQTLISHLNAIISHVSFTFKFDIFGQISPPPLECKATVLHFFFFILKTESSVVWFERLQTSVEKKARTERKKVCFFLTQEMRTIQTMVTSTNSVIMIIVMCSWAFRYSPFCPKTITITPLVCKKYSLSLPAALSRHTVA